MDYSTNLLNEYIDINQDLEEIAHQLTLKSCEIEEINQRQIPDGVVIGKCNKIEDHPNADKLSVVQVDCGDKGSFQIVCGGTNLKKNSYVPVALSGTYLPAIDMKIKKANLRDVESNGMICSKEELEIDMDTDKKWIWNLDQDLDSLNDQDLGKSLVKKYPKLNSAVYDVENKTITHRPDLTSHFGLANELKGVYSQFDKDYIVDQSGLDDILASIDDNSIFDKLSNFKESKKDLKIKTDKVRSYLMLELDDVDVSQSSFFTKLNMIDLGLQPKNNWVDFSNIFMNLSGNPVHFFDRDKIQGDVIVRNARQGESFVDLMGDKHELIEDDIVIADDEKILALAGVIGSQASAVTQDTENILFELANFDPVSVRRTGKRLGLRTDAEIRFEKNINPRYTLSVLDLFQYHIEDYEKDLGNVNIGGLDYYIDDEYKKEKQIELDVNQAGKFILGKEKSDFDKIIQNTLSSIGFDVNISDSQAVVSVPVWRGPADINIAEDLYEEIARMYGYNRIENRPVSSEIDLNVYSSEVELHRQVESIMVKVCDCDQIETYPWVQDSILEVFDISKESLFELQNPIAPDKKYMRDHLFYNIVDKLSDNSKFYNDIDLFEIGSVWKLDDSLDDSGDSRINTDKLTNETKKMIIAKYKEKVENRDQDAMLEVKQKFNILLDKLDINGKIDYEETDKDWLHPKKQGNIVLNGQKIGDIGQLHLLYHDDFKIDKNSQVVYLQVDMEVLEKIYQRQNKGGLSKSNYNTLQTQIVYRDLNFVLDKDKDYGQIIDQVKKVNEVKEIEIFDVYEGDNIPKGKKSIAIKMKILGDDYSSQEINEVMNKAIENAKKKGAKLRGE